jgi:hypothetical protein
MLEQELQRKADAELAAGLQAKFADIKSLFECELGIEPDGTKKLKDADSGLIHLCSADKASPKLLTFKEVVEALELVALNALQLGNRSDYAKQFVADVESLHNFSIGALYPTPMMFSESEKVLMRGLDDALKSEKVLMRGLDDALKRFGL